MSSKRIFLLRVGANLYVHCLQLVKGPLISHFFFIFSIRVSENGLPLALVLIQS